MRTGTHLTREFRLFLFQLRDVKKLLLIPGVFLILLIPLLLFLTMKKYEDLSYAEEYLELLAQYLMPVLSVWGPGFAFVNLIESEGEEVHYVNHRMKDSQMLLWLGLYLVFLALWFGIAGIWLEGVWMEYLRQVISCCFYTGLLYCVMYWGGSMTLAFLAVALYWMASLFAHQIPLDILNCYDPRSMTAELLEEKYIYLMLAAAVLYVFGLIGNRQKQQFH
ncbi:hypothetical protein [Zhenpiania hominis]|uniref:Uncharacterized protein n=1 Tax=Zhenpiania hominis TaxID=2763644 RepID=A0A923SRL2_9FIRM|nr:hypothetical protein [Zhenpiania hominis]MBC6680710.1 hypothetical protein [Zhenpiania hominis]